ncbi:MAG: nuclear transport factor 2 family protein [Sterolibacteriaceae bacterium]|uniref:Nuclear transport factor 2 family protein n=1 Tax=Candidatus Methylophosphatis roskildensis TaxID=2899263 RepID=A0A9D7E7V2_9PROT|nr:nuclear transport factor 2 family protein [Candidatus Methylophosphatis roskildensis]MBK7235563.1 nuclear transport factor 2 family protein [Sterolibacteriaceae bacterium]
MTALVSLDDIVAFYETLDTARLAELGRFYTADARFKDPFNEVRGVAAIRRVFEHMFETLEHPQFRVTDRIVDSSGAILLWEFHFGSPRRARCIRGASHLRFDTRGRIEWHRDYWDAAEELYAGLPVIGWLMRRLQRALRAPQPFD